MRTSFILYFLIGILFHAHAQTHDSSKSNIIREDGIAERMYVDSIRAKEDLLPDSLRIYDYVTEMPVFPGGGEPALNAFIRKNLVYPEEEKRRNIVGTVYIRFIVEKDGSLSSIYVIPGRGISPSCDQAAIDVISKSPVWTPGKYEGNIVRVRRVVKVNFVLQY